MRVIKIVKANLDLFGSDPKKQYTEEEAIRLVASMQPRGNKMQNKAFEIRQTHTAICNLLNLGFNEDAIDLAKTLIPKAEFTQQYSIAQDLCHKLTAHFYHINDVESANIYKSLYDKFTLNISYEHETMLLCNKAMQNYTKLENLNLINFDELNILIDAVEKKLPFDVTWYHYYYYTFKSLTLEGKSLEQLYLSAITYFEDLHHKHKYFSEVFVERLIMFYLDINELKNTEKYLSLLNSGTIIWFKSYLEYTHVLLSQNDLKSNDICDLVMNHPNFTNLHSSLKDKWKIAYKSTITMMLDN